jgi:hypothetical protein
MYQAIGMWSRLAKFSVRYQSISQEVFIPLSLLQRYNYHRAHKLKTYRATYRGERSSDYVV